MSQGRDVMVSIAGGDVDWDPLTYTIDQVTGHRSRAVRAMYTLTPIPVGLYGDTIKATDDSRPHEQSLRN